MSDKAKRSKLLAFLNTGTPAAPVWSLMGTGITSQTINYNPQTSDDTFINEDSGTVDVESYKPSIATPQTAYPGDAVFDCIDGLRKNRAVFGDARSEIIFVYAYETATGGAYSAEKNTCSIQVDDFGGDGGTALLIDYTVNLIGDPIKGTFNPTTLVFTADSVAALALSTIVPADAATGIAVTAPIVLTFNNKIKSESIVITTDAGAVVALTRSWNAAGTVLTLVPSTSLSASTTYLVAVAGVVDTYGQVLAASVTDFTTAA